MFENAPHVSVSKAFAWPDVDTFPTIVFAGRKRNSCQASSTRILYVFNAALASEGSSTNASRTIRSLIIFGRTCPCPLSSLEYASSTGSRGMTAYVVAARLYHLEVCLVHRKA